MRQSRSTSELVAQMMEEYKAEYLIELHEHNKKFVRSPCKHSERTNI